MGGNLVSNSNHVLSSLELATRGAGLILKVLLNPTSGRKASHPYTPYGTPYLRPSAYKARVGGVKPLLQTSIFLLFGDLTLCITVTFKREAYMVEQVCYTFRR